MRAQSSAQTVPHTRLAAVMFLDVEGFTRSLSSKSVDTVFAELSSCFGKINAIVESHGGRVSNVLGNGLLCYFPVAEGVTDEKELVPVCRSAISAAIQVQRDFAEQFITASSPGKKKENVTKYAFPVRIGVNAGAVLVGDVRLSDAQPAEFTLLGESINLAKRLESASEIFRILVSPKVKAILDADGAPQDFGVGAGWSRRFLQIKHQTGLCEAWDCDPFGDDAERLKGVLRLVRSGRKRAAPRIPWLSEVAFTATTRDGIAGRVIDFSDNGICVDFPAAFARKEQFSLTLSFAREEWNSILAKAGFVVSACEVRWVEAMGHSFWHGIAFTSFSYETSKSLTDLLIQFNNSASDEGQLLF